MSDLQRLIELARILPPVKVQALLFVAEQMTPAIPDEEFAKRLAAAPPADLDEEAEAELEAAWAERGETMIPEELKRALNVK
jgi:hypothetical protein